MIKSYLIVLEVSGHFLRLLHQCATDQTKQEEISFKPSEADIVIC